MNAHGTVWSAGRTLPGGFLPISQEALALSLFHLTHLLRAGVGLSDALEEVQLLEPGRRLRAVWKNISQAVSAGDSLSQAMSLWPQAFDEVSIALVRAGEVNGELEQACASCHDMLDWRMAARGRLYTALLYPLFALLVLSAVLIFLFVSVVPSLEQFLNATQSTLAWHSRALLHVSNWLTHAWLPLVASVVLLVLTTLALRQTLKTFRRLTDHWLLQMPILGTLFVELSLSRYALVCSRLYRSGVDLDHSLHISEGVLRNSVLRQSLVRVRESLNAGATLSESMDTTTRLPASFRRILAAGESAGALGQALSQAGDQHHRRAQLQLDRVERLAGPLTLTLVGANLLWVIISVLSPVYDSAMDAVLLS